MKTGLTKRAETVQPASVNHSEPKYTKNPISKVPAPQRERIRKRFIAGQSIRQISREEGRARETVTKIVQCAEVETYIEELRRAYISLGFDALEAVRHALTVKKDGWLGYQILKDIGVVPSESERLRRSTSNNKDDTQQSDIERIAAQMATHAVKRVRASLELECGNDHTDSSSVGPGLRPSVGEEV